MKGSAKYSTSRSIQSAAWEISLSSLRRTFFYILSTPVVGYSFDDKLGINATGNFAMNLAELIYFGVLDRKMANIGLFASLPPWVIPYLSAPQVLAVDAANVLWQALGS